jgi:hypothetical protein
MLLLEGEDPEAVVVSGVVVQEATVPLLDTKHLVVAEADRTVAATTTMVATIRTMQVISSAKSASRETTPPTNVGTGSMIPMSPSRRLQPLHPIHTTSIQIGMRTLAQPAMSLAN